MRNDTVIFVRKISCIILVLVLFSSISTMSLDGDKHAQDAIYILTGVATGKCDEEILDSKSCEIIKFAMSYSIDAFSDTQLTKYSEFTNLVREKGGTTVLNLPATTELKFGAQNHREYNHQGFYYDYTGSRIDKKNEKRKRWEVGRDKILIPSIAVAFGMDVNDSRAEIISIIVYYTHIIGDIYEVKQEDTNKALGNIKTYWGAIQQLKTDLKSACRKASLKVPKNLGNLKFKRNINKKTREEGYIASKNHMRETLSPLIEEIFGIPVEKESGFFQKLWNW